MGNDTLQSPNLFGLDETRNTVLTSAKSAGAGVVLSAGGLASYHVRYAPTSGHAVGKTEFDSLVLATLSSTTTRAASDCLASTGIPVSTA